MIIKLDNWKNTGNSYIMIYDGITIIWKQIISIQIYTPDGWKNEA